MRIVAFLPPVEGLWADIIVTAGKAGIVATGMVIVKPF
jgi:hypothetical protein